MCGATAPDHTSLFQKLVQMLPSSNMNVAMTLIGPAVVLSGEYPTAVIEEGVLGISFAIVLSRWVETC
jgi:hypothetical protein